MTNARSAPAGESRAARDKTTAAIRRESAFERPLVTVDVVILTLREGRLQVLLMKRATAPFRGIWALPGGYIHPEEDADLESAARRILRQKTGIEPLYVEQLEGFGDGRRDPRGWTATFAYFALIASEALVLREGANAGDLAWRELTDGKTDGRLAFDHARIVACAVDRLRRKVEYTTLPIHLLPAKFTLPDLQRVYEQILGRRMDKSAFRKRMAEEDFLEAIAGERRPASNRPAQYYRVKPERATIFFDRTI